MTRRGVTHLEKKTKKVLLYQCRAFDINGNLKPAKIDYNEQKNIKKSHDVHICK